MKVGKAWPGGQENENNPLSQSDISRMRQETSKRAHILNPKEVQEKEEVRIRRWAHSIISKHEHKFTPKWQDRQIITSGEVKPEDIDARAVYPYPDLNWVIWKNKDMWSFMLLSQHRMLFNIDFAKI